MKKGTKRALTIITTILLVIVCGGAVYLFGVSLNRKVTSNNEKEAYTSLYQRDSNLKPWIDSLNAHHALRDTFIISNDGSRLHALYVSSATHSPKTALIIHGYGDNSIRMLMIGHLYNRELGYNILLPDLHAHGESEGKYIQMGWKDRQDILKWIEVSKGIYGDSIRLVIHGISMGAATTMMVSGEKLPSNVKCFVEDCGYTSVWDEFKYQLKEQYGLPAFPVLYVASLYTQAKEGWNFKQASSLEQVKKCRLPMLFIHGGSDSYVPTWMAYKLYAAKTGEKELWIIPEAVHANAYWARTAEYVSKTRRFVEKYMEK